MMVRRTIPLVVLLGVTGARLTAAAPPADAKREVPRGPGTERDKECLVCHAGVGEEEAPKLDLDLYAESVHAEDGCIGCHPDVEDEDIAHEEVDEDLGPAACGSCHDQPDEELEHSIHRVPPVDAEAELPSCGACHGAHDIVSVSSPRSPVHAVQQLETCGSCHDSSRNTSGHKNHIPEEFADIVAGGDPETVERLREEGKLVVASCSDCHGAHDSLAHDDPESRLFPPNTTETCGECHVDEQRDYEHSSHAAMLEKDDFTWPTGSEEYEAHRAQYDEDGALPAVCTSCHQIHDSAPATTDAFRFQVTNECGLCHADLFGSYMESYHGKATVLGLAAAAKCSDCHGFHSVLPADDPNSTVSKDNRLEMCQTCHAGAPPNFADFIPHADPTDRDDYPVLFWVYAFMSLLMISVFSFFGLHTLLWGIREVLDALRYGAPQHQVGGARIRRFGPVERVLHLLVIVSFLGLAATGTPLKFAQAPWAKSVLSLIGGVEVAGTIHRVLGVVTFVYFFGHIVQLLYNLWPRVKDGTLVRLLMGPDSLVPRWSDFTDAVANFRYFLGLAPKPTFDRWTYWEKFDYWAVFWGVAIIGTSGLILWFPTWFTTFLPGWAINVALIVHSDEALLAMGFIFGVHFFNSHMRRSKFPMDDVMFTGSVPIDEFKAERGRQWARQADQAEHDVRPGRAFMFFARVFGITAWMFGLVLLAFIIHGFFFVGGH